MSLTFVVGEYPRETKRYALQAIDYTIVFPRRNINNKILFKIPKNAEQIPEDAESTTQEGKNWGQSPIFHRAIPVRKARPSHGINYFSPPLRPLEFFSSNCRRGLTPFIRFWIILICSAGGIFSGSVPPIRLMASRTSLRTLLWVWIACS